jgi:hypothetical protein
LLLALMGPVVTFGTISSLLRVILFMLLSSGAIASLSPGVQEASGREPLALIAMMLVRGSLVRPFAGMTRIRF